MSPNRVFLGHEVRLPVDLALGAAPDVRDAQLPISEHVRDLQERMYRDGVFVRERLGRAALRMKTRYDARVRPSFSFSAGDRVWYFYPRRYSKLSPKWQNLYVGPYRVVRLIDPCNVVIKRNARAREMVVHRDKLRPAVSLNQQVSSTNDDEMRRPAVSLNQQVNSTNDWEMRRPAASLNQQVNPTKTSGCDKQIDEVKIGRAHV
jgi:hypothetical protein